MKYLKMFLVVGMAPNDLPLTIFGLDEFPTLYDIDRFVYFKLSINRKLWKVLK